MATEQELRKKKIIAMIKEFTNPTHQKLVKEGMGWAKDAEKALDQTVQVLEKIKTHMERGNTSVAEYLYKNAFFKTGKLHIKRAFTKDEILKFLNKKSLLQKTLDKSQKARDILRKVVGPCAKVVDNYEKLCKAVNVSVDFDKLMRQQGQLKTAGEYRNYYMNLAEKFAKVSGVLKGVSSMLPAGASDYLEFVFTGAEKTGKFAKIVGNYSERIVREFTAYEKLQKAIEKKGNKLGDTWKFTDKNDKGRSLRDYLDIRLGNPSVKK
jgi:hypothetical protein